MGSWNATCGITQVPILYKEPVALIFLVQTRWPQPRAEGTHYATDHWAPLGAPLYGTYDDYGQVEFSDHPHTDGMLQMLREQVLPKEQGPNSVHDLPIDPKTLTWDNVFQAISQDRLMVQGPRCIGMMMVHQKIYEHLSDSTATLYGDRLTVESLEEQGRHYLEQTMMPSSNDEDDIEQFLRRRKPFLERLFSKTFDRGVMQDFLDYEALVLQHPEEMISLLARFAIFHHHIDALRKLYMPPSGLGSQDPKTLQHLQLTQVTIDLLKTRLQDEED